ncbi:hypothetical protein LBK6_03135 [Leptospira borgpetersenii serovar Hardjo]|nr:hypothetical protein LBK6_03135 [Leptospira borgpetersenii serovar Hardjo]AMX60631.1 hypothetical protein LBK9_03080 [Leptospira borgpetersenii serovar Hardjo]AMX63875.1 hypothetical protein LBK30_03120 [Leptospira borgpetersenii serovar Hardjo]AMX67116.1 hypothetical protein LBHA_03095 [Leptospira borgpetersenii serovar Hardjo]
MIHFSKNKLESELCKSILKIWEFPQIKITILRTNSKIVGTLTFRKLFLIFNPNSHYLKLLRKFYYEK